MLAWAWAVFACLVFVAITIALKLFCKRASPSPSHPDHRDSGHNQAPRVGGFRSRLNHTQDTFPLPSSQDPANAGRPIVPFSAAPPTQPPRPRRVSSDGELLKKFPTALERMGSIERVPPDTEEATSWWKYDLTKAPRAVGSSLKHVLRASTSNGPDSTPVIPSLVRRNSEGAVGLSRMNPLGYKDMNLLLRDKAACSIFLDFLIQILGSENLLFFFAIEEFRDSADHVQDAIMIYEEYIKNGAKGMINISGSVQNAITKEITLMHATNRMSDELFELFDKAQSDIYCLLETDLFPRFLASPQSNEWKQKFVREPQTPNNRSINLSRILPMMRKSNDSVAQGRR